MANQPATTPSRSRLARLLPWLMVLLVILLVGFIRFRVRDMPLERDEGEYAYAGQLILQGIPPYELAYNMKLPGTYYAYALGMAVFGETCAGVHLTLLVADALTILFVFLLGKRLFGTTAGVVACACYGVMAVSPLVLGMAAHASHFIVLFAVPATVVLLAAAEDKQPMTLFLSGLLYGLAFLMGQQGICFCLFSCFVLAWRALMDKSIFSTGFVKSALTLGLGICLPFLFLCLACLVAGDFARFWFWTFVYAGKYISLTKWSVGLTILLGHLQSSWKVSLPFWLLAIAAPPLTWLNRDRRRQMLFAVSFWCFSFLGVAAGFYFRSHYFVLVLPAFAILTGAAVVSLQRILRFGSARTFLQMLPLGLFAAALGWAVNYQAVVFFQLPPLQVFEIIYGQEPFIESIVVAQYIREHSAPDARIAVMGSEPEIYFYAHRHSATGYIYTYPLMEAQPAAPAMQRDMMRQIETNRPEYIVTVPYQLSWLVRADSDHTILNWMKEYVPKFYDKVGLVGFDNRGKLIAFWGKSVTNAPSWWKENIRVYRRKTKPAPAVKH